MNRKPSPAARQERVPAILGGHILSIWSILFLLSSQPSWPEPEPLIDHIFTFTPPVPPAQGIWIAGEFNNWDWTGLPLEKQPDGSWSRVLHLPAGEYRYLLKVDGSLQPQAAPLVAGRPWHFPDPDAPQGKLEKITLPAGSGPGVTGWLYLPPDHPPEGLILLLHGNGGRSEDWVEGGQIAVIADNLLHRKKIPPLALFIPDLTPLRARPDFLTLLSLDIPGKLEEIFKGGTPFSHKALLGVSQGGADVYRIFRDVPKKFEAYGALAGWWDPQNMAAELKSLPGDQPPLSLWCGTGDGLVRNARTLQAAAGNQGWTWPLTETSGGHNWECWNRLSPRMLIWTATVWQKDGE